MTAPSVTLRALKNEETGIDMSVPGIQEEEAPLGGISVLYKIVILTKLELYKNRLCKSEDVVYFCIFKAYRELEDLYNKLTKKYPKVALPPVPKSNVADTWTNEKKIEVVSAFLDAISRNSELCNSPVFTQFIGISSQKVHSLSNEKATSSDNHGKESVSALEQAGNHDSENKALDEVFPKMKAPAPETPSKALQSVSKNVSNVDLFEEVKLVKETSENTNIGPNEHKNSVQCLFDELEDDSLFCSKPTPKTVPSEKPAERVNEPKPIPKKKEISKPILTNENVDDSQIIIKDRKLADISLFDEQDFGEYITKDEEALFLVSSNKNKDSKKNTLLLFEGLPSSETDSSLNENLDDLLNLEPLPDSPVGKEFEKESVTSKSEETDSSISEAKTREDTVVEDTPNEETHSKPVPLPRKKSLAKSEGETLMSEGQKPEVMPRKVFLNKPEVPSKPSSSSPPQVPAKPKPSPAVQAKPAPPPKPKPPPKRPKLGARKSQDEDKILDIANANQPQEVTGNINTVSDLANDLHKLDILKYIEQEEKSLEAKPSLFD